MNVSMLIIAASNAALIMLLRREWKVKVLTPLPYARGTSATTDCEGTNTEFFKIFYMLARKIFRMCRCRQPRICILIAEIDSDSMRTHVTGVLTPSFPFQPSTGIG